MYKHVKVIGAAALVAAAAGASVSSAQTAVDPTALAATLSTQYRVTPNITYITASNTELKLDFYQASRATAAVPTLVFFHGGGYRLQAKKEASILSLLPYLQMGWNVANVEYRSSAVAHAPAAAEDARCAVRWVMQNAKEYKVDVDRIVLSGQSAGGHLALLTAVASDAAGLDNQCPGEALKVAAVVNWYGITDFSVLMNDPSRTYAISWLGAQPNRKDIATLVSPLTYARAGLPPIITVQGDGDPTVPYDQNVRLHEALKKNNVPNELVTISAKTHGNFAPNEYVMAFGKIRDFLTTHGVIKTAAAPTSAQR